MIHAPARALPALLVLCALVLMPGGSAHAALTALAKPSGEVVVSAADGPVVTVSPGVFAAGWRAASLKAAQGADEPGQPLGGELRAGDATVDTELRLKQTADGLHFNYRLAPRSALEVNSVHASVNVPAGRAAGRPFTFGPEQGRVPEELDEVHLATGEVDEVRLALAERRPLEVRLPEAGPVLLQDNRRWGPSVSVRIGPQWGEPHQWSAGEEVELQFVLDPGAPVELEYDRPVRIMPGEDWVPLELELDIEPGSALDFSGMGQLDPPAGKHGRVITGPRGTFAFADSPDVPRRFYGVNLCFSAHYITHARAEALADRLARLGYNTVRFHHYEGELVDRSSAGWTRPSGEKLDQLDYLLAALKRRGIYVTTDLFVSRPVPAGAIWPQAEGRLGGNDYKMLVLVNERAFENWKAFARHLLGHRNPYTDLTWAEDPAVAWLSMINEGNAGNYIRGIDGRTAEEWQRAWNRYLAEKYGDHTTLANAWERDPGGDPAAGTVPLYRNPRADGPRGRDLARFITRVERSAFRRMRSFLREELGCEALLTNMNSWTNPLPVQAVRREFDYVDEHFYVDHPHFLERRWRLPSRCDSDSPVADGRIGGLSETFHGLLDKPFTVSEWNYAAPGAHRAVGGILTGSVAALQGWDAAWRFAYSHSRGNLFEPGRMGYFDLASDPLNQASDRAAVCLYLRGDMQAAPHAVGVAMTESQLGPDLERNRGVSPPWSDLALVTGVGTFLAQRPGPAPADLIVPLPWGAAGAGWQAPAVLKADPHEGQTGSEIVDEMKRRGWLSRPGTDLAAGRYHSETGQLRLDRGRDVLAVTTPRTAGGYAPEGARMEAGPVTVQVKETDAAVWVSSLEERPIPRSGRLLVTHLTDCQNSGARFGERARETLLQWGSPPHLLLNGRATLKLDLEAARSARVLALSTGGRRLGEVEAALSGSTLTVPLAVRGPRGARMLYEIEVTR